MRPAIDAAVSLRGVRARKPFLVFAIVAFALLGLGLAGTWAFNPQDGAVAQSDPVWVVFALATYMGIIGAVAVGLAMLYVALGSAGTRLKLLRR